MLLNVKFYLAVHIPKTFLSIWAYIHIINSLSTTVPFASQQPPSSKLGLGCNSHFTEDSPLFQNKECGLKGSPKERQSPHISQEREVERSKYLNLERLRSLGSAVLAVENYYNKK